MHRTLPQAGLQLRSHIQSLVGEQLLGRQLTAKGTPGTKPRPSGSCQDSRAALCEGTKPTAAPPRQQSRKAAEGTPRAPSATRGLRAPNPLGLPSGKGHAENTACCEGCLLPTARPSSAPQEHLLAQVDEHSAGATGGRGVPAHATPHGGAARPARPAWQPRYPGNRRRKCSASPSPHSSTSGRGKKTP